MASKVAQKSAIASDSIYTSALIEKAKGKHCNVCTGYITDSEAESRDFSYSKTKRGSEIFIHNHCWKRVYVS